jgi:O-antigen/teichoic acid export membrane protein
MTAIYGQIGKIILGQLMTDTDVGLYTAANAIAGMWVFVPTAIINSFRPMVMERKQEANEKEYRLRLMQLYSLVIWLCIFVALVVTVLAKPAIQILYGNAYLGSVASLRIIIWSELFAMIGTARGIWILCENKNKYVKYYLAIGAVVSVILNCILIPWIGIKGAAVATLTTQFVTSIVAPLFFKRTREHTKIVIDSFTCKWYFERKKRNGN